MRTTAPGRAFDVEPDMGVEHAGVPDEVDAGPGVAADDRADLADAAVRRHRQARPRRRQPVHPLPCAPPGQAATRAAGSGPRTAFSRAATSMKPPARSGTSPM